MSNEPTGNAGDPTGRRLARQRAALLAEAGRLSRSLELILERARFDPEPARTLTRAIASQEQTELLRAAGRIESRKRFHGGTLVRPSDREQRHVLFIDESGKSIRAGSDYFALAGVAMTLAEEDRYKTRADAVKRAFFGDDREITFHEPDMRHREGRFYFGGNVDRQLEFDAAIARLIASTQMTAFGVAIRKLAFADFLRVEGDPYLPTDVYAIAIQMLLERYVDFRARTAAGRRSHSKVVFEAQGPKEDALHQRDYADLLLEGTQWISAKTFMQWLETGARFTPKQGSDPVELADMLSRDMYEWVESGCIGEPARWASFTPKVYCHEDGAMGKFGIKVFPDSDIREAVLAHRAVRIGT